MQKQLEDIIGKMSEELGVPYDVCADAYMSQWHFILQKINSFSIKDMTPEEFEAHKHNFNIPSIGKFCITRKKYDAIKRKTEYYKTHIQNVQNQKDTPDVQHGDNHDERIQGGGEELGSD